MRCGMTRRQVNKHSNVRALSHKAKLFICESGPAAVCFVQSWFPVRLNLTSTNFYGDKIDDSHVGVVVHALFFVAK